MQVKPPKGQIVTAGTIYRPHCPHPINKTRGRKEGHSLPYRCSHYPSQQPGPPCWNIHHQERQIQVKPDLTETGMVLNDHTYIVAKCQLQKNEWGNTFMMNNWYTCLSFDYMSTMHEEVLRIIMQHYKSTV